jgi:hypothetical protein
MEGPLRNQESEMPNNQSNRGNNNRGGSTSRNTRRPRDDEGRFTSQSWTSTARENPYATAALAAGVAAASAFLWSRRGQISEFAETGMDRLSEFKAERMGDTRSQSEIAEEALSLKETGNQSQGSRGPAAPQSQKAGVTA